MLHLEITPVDASLGCQPVDKPAKNSQLAFLSRSPIMHQEQFTEMLHSVNASKVSESRQKTSFSDRFAGNNQL